jgi:hypothetical protein
MTPVLLQAMKEDPAPDAKCRDKFLVQSVLVTADKEFSNVAALVRKAPPLRVGAWLTSFPVVEHRADIEGVHPGAEDQGPVPRR